MILIPNTKNISAEYKSDNGGTVENTVVAWDEDGEAYIIGDKKLEHARSYKNFIQLVEDTPLDLEPPSMYEIEESLEKIAQTLERIEERLKEYAPGSQ